eukprot:134733_1
MMPAIYFLIMNIFTVGFCHLCLLNPYQRNYTVPDGEINKPGSTYCGLETAPCGKVPSDHNYLGENLLVRGQPQTSVLIKNLDHYNAQSPGNFTISLWNALKNSKVKDLGHTMDTSAGSGTIYQIPYTIPATAGDGHFFLQAVYYPNNPNAPKAFYQCADIHIDGPP